MKDLTEKEKEELLKWKRGVKFFFLIPIKVFLFLSIKVKKHFGFFLFVSFIVFCVTFSYIKFKDFLIEECNDRKTTAQYNLKLSYNKCLSECPHGKCYSGCEDICDPCTNDSCNRCRDYGDDLTRDCQDECRGCDCRWRDHYLECNHKCENIMKNMAKQYIQQECEKHCKYRFNTDHPGYYSSVCERKSFENLFTGWIRTNKTLKKAIKKLFSNQIP